MRINHPSCKINYIFSHFSGLRTKIYYKQQKRIFEQTGAHKNILAEEAKERVFELMNVNISVTRRFSHIIIQFFTVFGVFCALFVLKNSYMGQEAVFLIKKTVVLPKITTAFRLKGQNFSFQIDIGYKIPCLLLPQHCIMQYWNIYNWQALFRRAFVISFNNF